MDFSKRMSSLIRAHLFLFYHSRYALDICHRPRSNIGTVYIFFNNRDSARTIIRTVHILILSFWDTQPFSCQMSLPHFILQFSSHIRTFNNWIFVPEKYVWGPGVGRPCLYTLNEFLSHYSSFYDLSPRYFTGFYPIRHQYFYRALLRYYYRMFPVVIIRRFVN